MCTRPQKISRNLNDKNSISELLPNGETIYLLVCSVLYNYAQTFMITMTYVFIKSSLKLWMICSVLCRNYEIKLLILFPITIR